MPDRNGRQTQRGAFRLIEGGSTDRRSTTERRFRYRTQLAPVLRRAA